MTTFLRSIIYCRNWAQGQQILITSKVYSPSIIIKYDVVLLSQPIAGFILRALQTQEEIKENNNRNTFWFEKAKMYSLGVLYFTFYPLLFEISSQLKLCQLQKGGIIPLK